MGKNVLASSGDIETRVQSPSGKDPLEEGMAPSSSILAWRIPWTEETKDMWVQFLGWEDSPGGGQGDPLQYSWLENPMDRGA